MAWARIHDGAMSHPKISALSDAAFRVWVKGLAFCQMNLTDGIIPRNAAKEMGGTKRVLDELILPLSAEYKPLWLIHPIGFVINDYLYWNDSREHVQTKRELGRRRKQEWERKQRENAGSERVVERVTERGTNARHSTPPTSTRTPLTPLAGGRVTRGDRKHAREIREKAHGGCRHEPRCENYDACVELIAQELADRRTEAAS